jgi:alcohol dehydrogenase class IV
MQKYPQARERYAVIARTVGLTGSEAGLVKALCNKIDQYNEFLHIPHAMKDYEKRHCAGSRVSGKAARCGSTGFKRCLYRL